MYTEDPSGVSSVYISPQNLMCTEDTSGVSSVYISPQNLCTEDTSGVSSVYISPQNLCTQKIQVAYLLCTLVYRTTLRAIILTL